MPRIGARLIGVSLLFGLTAPCASAAEYSLIPNPQTVHVGYFSAALKPVPTINSGDTVTIESVAGLDPAIIDASGVVPPSAVPEYVRAIGRDVTDRGPGPHFLTGPIRTPLRAPGVRPWRRLENRGGRSAPMLRRRRVAFRSAVIGSIAPGALVSAFGLLIGADTAALLHPPG